MRLLIFTVHNVEGKYREEVVKQLKKAAAERGFKGKSLIVTVVGDAADHVADGPLAVIGEIMNTYPDDHVRGADKFAETIGKAVKTVGPHDVTVLLRQCSAGASGGNPHGAVVWSSTK